MKKIFLILILLTVFYIHQTAYADSLNSVVSINVNGGMGFPWGKLMNEEKDAVTMYVEYSDGTRKNGSPDHEVFQRGFLLDISPFDPAITGSLISAYKFGFRFKYNWNRIQQKIVIGGGEYEEKEWREDLMTFNSAIGGVVLFIYPSLLSDENNPSDKNYSSEYSISVFALFGKVINGEITPYPISQKELSIPEAKSDMSGYRMETGLGYEYSGRSSLHVGMNLFYSYTAIKTDTRFYDAGKDLNYSEFTFDLYVGLSF